MINKKTRHLVVGGIVTGALLAVSAAGPAIASAPSIPAKGAPIVLLVQTTIDNPTLTFPGLFTGASVAAAGINAAGGVNGRPIKIYTCDDKSNTSLGAQCAQQAIAAGAVARVSSLSVVGSAVQPLLQNAKFADFGSIPAAIADMNAFNQFPLGSGAAFYSGFPGLMKQKFPTAKTAVVIGTDSAQLAQNRDRLSTAAVKAGMTVLDQIAIPARTADLSSIVGQMQRLNPDIVLAQISPPDLVKYWSAAKALGFSKPTINSSTGITPEFLAQAGDANRWNYYADYYPSFLSTVAGASDFRAQFAKYAAGQTATRDAWVAWVGVQTLASILKSMKGAITPSTVIGTLQHVKCFNALYYKCLNFSKPGPIPTTPAIRVGTVFMLEPKAGQLVGTKYTANLFDGL